ncbi:MAG: hypothetical protein M1837_000790 [Sclerophora amabilis]|nr:MAG: hypothetical protein M1837_000790 [Sclerophora amabilis]
MEDVRKFILTCDGVLRSDLTPLLRHEMKTALDNHLHAIYQPPSEINNQIMDGLQTQRRSIEAHWNRTNKDMKKFGDMFREMRVIEFFLQDKLSEDYVDASYAVPERVLDLARIKGDAEDRKLAASRLTGGNEDELDKLYQEVVVSPVEELMLDLGYVELRMRAALARGGKPGSDIQPLVDSCNWADLATILVEDRKYSPRAVAGSLQPTLANWIVLHRLNDVQKTYFTELSSEGAFTINAHARALSRKLASSSDQSQDGVSSQQLSRGTAMEEDQQPLLSKVSSKFFGMMHSMLEPTPQESLYHRHGIGLKKTE